METTTRTHHEVPRPERETPRPEREQVVLGAEPAMDPPRDPADAFPTRRERIPALTGIRILLALVLVMHHTLRYLTLDSDRSPRDFGVLYQGPVATCGFFVLAGIGLYWAYGERLAHDATLETWGRYLRRRWAAVAPLGALGAVLAIPGELLARIMEGAELWVTFALNVVLLQAWIPAGGGEHGVSLRFDGPTWTLSALLFAYVAFPIVALLVHRRIRTRLGLVVLGAAPWLAVVACAWAYADQPLGTWMLHVLPIMRFADVLAGVAIGAWIVRHGRPGARAGWLLQGAAVVVVPTMMMLAGSGTLDRGWYYGAWYIPPVALLAYSLTALDGPLTRVFALAPIERAGRVAFALLMLHMPLLLLGSELGWVEFGNLHGVAIMLAVCLFGAWIVHLKVERPLVRRLAGPPALAHPRMPLTSTRR